MEIPNVLKDRKKACIATPVVVTYFQIFPLRKFWMNCRLLLDYFWTWQREATVN